MGGDTWGVGRGCCSDVCGDDPLPLEPLKIIKLCSFPNCTFYNLDILNIEQHCIVALPLSVRVSP